MKLLREVVEPQLVELGDALLERDDVVAAERLESRLRRVDADAGRACVEATSSPRPRLLDGVEVEFHAEPAQWR